MKYTTVATHKLYNSNSILETSSLYMCCIDGTLSFLNRSIKTKGLVNNLNQSNEILMKILKFDDPWAYVEMIKEQRVQ